MSRKIYQIDSIELTILKSLPLELVISVEGQVSTPGWCNGQIIPWDNKTQLNGIYDFEFVADPPEKVALHMLMPISATLKLSHIPPNMKGVRIIASTNFLESKIVEASSEFNLSERNNNLSCSEAHS